MAKRTPNVAGALRARGGGGKFFSLRNANTTQQGAGRAGRGSGTSGSQ